MKNRKANKINLYRFLPGRAFAGIKSRDAVIQFRIRAAVTRKVSIFQSAVTENSKFIFGFFFQPNNSCSERKREQFLNDLK